MMIEVYLKFELAVRVLRIKIFNNEKATSKRNLISSFYSRLMLWRRMCLLNPSCRLLASTTPFRLII
jgi:hypothetical protein